MAAGKRHRTLVDAIWGYTQFLLDEETRKLLVICTKSGLYEWLRMPFGPAPAPAEMQSYVATKFGNLHEVRAVRMAAHAVWASPGTRGNAELRCDEVREPAKQVRE